MFEEATMGALRLGPCTPPAKPRRPPAGPTACPVGGRPVRPEIVSVDVSGWWPTGRQKKSGWWAARPAGKILLFFI